MRLPYIKILYNSNSLHGNIICFHKKYVIYVLKSVCLYKTIMNIMVLPLTNGIEFKKQRKSF